VGSRGIGVVGEVDGRWCCSLVWLASTHAEERDEAAAYATDGSSRWKRSSQPRVEALVDGRVLRSRHVDEPLLCLLLSLLHALQHREHACLKIILSSRTCWLNFLRLRWRWHHAAKLLKNGNALVRARRRECVYASQLKCPGDRSLSGERGSLSVGAERELRHDEQTLSR
jgi:hypothetical protein